MSTARACSFEANGRTYHLGPAPVAVICVDGCSQDYLDAAIEAGAMPNTERLIAQGFGELCLGCLPSYTNVNNSAIVTGTPPSVHGISGNFFLDPETGEEVMMNSPEFLRVSTIFPAAEAAGRRIAVLTSKDKLRTILAHELERPIAFSAERCRDATEEVNGITDVESLVGMEAPSVYSAEASVFVIAAGAALVEADKADLLYLSTTDYIQHKHAPDEPEAIEFHRAMDREIGRLLDAGCVVGLTADHGMNAKQKEDGTPDVLFLEEVLAEEYGDAVTVILPITDPYVVHHGALGSFAVVHLGEGADADAVYASIKALPGITEVYQRDEAAKRLELPADRIGDIVCVSGQSVVLGRRRELHDLTAVEQGLRSHGGRHETEIPFLVSGPLPEDWSERQLRNFDLFEATCLASHLAATAHS
ncbi:MAG: phosphonoacetate hydrolase [Planctomycetes bacterium]|nr:phosphonoacetate hydrolase [Planctomycetota bacterium]